MFLSNTDAGLSSGVSVCILLYMLYMFFIQRFWVLILIDLVSLGRDMSGSLCCFHIGVNWFLLSFNFCLNSFQLINDFVWCNIVLNIINCFNLPDKHLFTIFWCVYLLSFGCLSIFLAFDFCRFCVVIRFFHPCHNDQWPQTSKDFLSQVLSITFIFLS